MPTQVVDGVDDDARAALDAYRAGVDVLPCLVDIGGGYVRPVGPTVDRAREVLRLYYDEIVALDGKLAWRPRELDDA